MPSKPHCHVVGLVDLSITLGIFIRKRKCMICKPHVIIRGSPCPYSAWMVCKRLLVKFNWCKDDMTRTHAMDGRKHLTALYDHLYHMLVAQLTCGYKRITVNNEDIHAYSISSCLPLFNRIPFLTCGIFILSSRITMSFAQSSQNTFIICRINCCLENLISMFWMVCI